MRRWPLPTTPPGRSMLVASSGRRARGSTPRRASRPEGRPQACPASQPRERSCRARTAIRSPSSRRRKGTASRTPAAAPRAHGRVCLRLLPRHPGGHGVDLPRRPGPTSSSRPAATPTSRTSVCSRRRSGTSCSTRTTSTRPCPRRGSGTSSASRPASSSPVRRTASAPAKNRMPPWGTVRSYRHWMARYARMRLPRGLVLDDHRRRHPRGRRTWPVGPGPPLARAGEPRSKPSSPRPAITTACGPPSR